MTREEALHRVEGYLHADGYSDTKEIIKALEQEPTTKKDLGVDCISREEAIKTIQRYGVGCFDADEFSPEECERFVMAKLNELDSVTPIRPKGHWIDTNYHHYYDDGDIETTELRCSCCSEEVEWDIKLLHKPYYCENCGADMNEVKK